MKLLKKNLSLLLVMILLISTFGASFAQADFTDLNEVAWAKDTVEKWAKIGLVSGYGDGTFKPGNEITRAEFATLALNAFGLESATVKGFTDVKVTDWFYGPVSQLAGMGIVNGYGDGTFNPNAPITRAEAAIILVNIQGLAVNPAATVAFEDAVEIPEWAKGQIGAAYEAGYVSGYPDGTFGPGKNITRAEAIVMMDKTIYGENQFAKNWVINHEGIYGDLTEKTVVEGSVYVRSEGVVLRNLEIKGDLILGKEIADGNAFLQSVTVAGDTEVNGGGEDSIYITNSQLGTVRVQKENGRVRLVAVGNTTVASVQSTTVVKLEEQNIGSADSGFGEVIIDESVKGEVVLVGTFTKVTVNAPGITIVVPEDTVIEEMEVNAAVEVTGTGSVETATVSVDGVSFEMEPEEVVATEEGIEVVVAGEEQEAPVASAPAPTPAPAPAPGPAPGPSPTPTPTEKLYYFYVTKTEDGTTRTTLLHTSELSTSSTVNMTFVNTHFTPPYAVKTTYQSFAERALAQTSPSGNTFAEGLISRIQNTTETLLVFDAEDDTIEELSAAMANANITNLYSDFKKLYSDENLPDAITMKIHGVSAAGLDLDAMESQFGAKSIETVLTTPLIEISMGDITIIFKITDSAL